MTPTELRAYYFRVRAERARRSFREFAKQYWSVVEPAEPLVWGWHLDAVCDHLEAVTRGWIRKLLINMPPGLGKSLFAAVLWPAWNWVNNPSWRVLASSYADELTTRDAMRARDVVESPEYVAAFRTDPQTGEVLWKLKDDQNTKHTYYTSESGFRLSLSTGSKATGLRGNCVLGDDLLNATDWSSKAAREKAAFYWQKTMFTRVNKPDRDAFVLIMQRLHMDDPAGRVLKSGGYEHLCLPTEFNPSRRSRTYYMKPKALTLEESDHVCQAGGEVRRVRGELRERAVFFTDPRTEKGELLFPELHTPEVVAEARKELKDQFPGQHNQDPVAAEGGMFKYHYWRFFRAPWFAGRDRPAECVQEDASPTVDLPPKLYVVGSVDAAFRGNPDNDPVSIGVVGACGAFRFLLWNETDQMTFSETKDAMRRIQKMFAEEFKLPIIEWYVEGKANGDAIVDDLVAEFSGIQTIDPEGGKESRAARAEPVVKAGQLALPVGAPWVQGFVDECAAFPRSTHDDQVDMMSQAVNQLADSAVLNLLASLG